MISVMSEFEIDRNPTSAPDLSFFGIESPNVEAKKKKNWNDEGNDEATSGPSRPHRGHPTSLAADPRPIGPPLHRPRPLRPPIMLPRPSGLPCLRKDSLSCRRTKPDRVSPPPPEPSLRAPDRTPPPGSLCLLEPLLASCCATNSNPNLDISLLGFFPPTSARPCRGSSSPAPASPSTGSCRLRHSPMPSPAIPDPASQPESDPIQHYRSVPDLKVKKKLTLRKMDFGNKLIRLKEVDEELVLLKNLFYLNSAHVAKFCPVVEIYRNAQFRDTRKSCFDALFLFSRTRLGKNNDLGIIYAWHGASEDVISQILDKTSDSKEPRDNGSCRVLCLSKDPEQCAIDSIVSSEVNDNGLKHLLFCRVISPEVSQEFMAWNPHVDKHVQLLCVLTIKPRRSSEELVRMPTHCLISPLVSGKLPGSLILAVISELVPLPTMYLIRKAYNECVELKITHEQMVFRMKQLAGETLLHRISVAYMKKLKEIVQKQKKQKETTSSSERKEIGGS